MPEIALVAPAGVAAGLAQALRGAGALTRVCESDQPDLERRLFAVRPDAALVWLGDEAHDDLDGLRALAERMRALAVPALAILPERPSRHASDILSSFDDIVFAPLRAGEVLLRLRLAALRRGADTAHHTAGGLTLDPEGFRVFLHGEPLPLTYKEFELLRFLLVNRGRVVSREAILQHVWGYDFYGGLRTVDAHIRRLRSKIEPRAPGTIETIRNVGYRIP